MASTAIRISYSQNSKLGIKPSSAELRVARTSARPMVRLSCRYLDITRAAEKQNGRRNSHSSGKHDAAISAGGNWNTPPHWAQKVSNVSAVYHDGCENVFF